ncbi:MAG: hypothetical protein LUQ59_02170 [Methanothrix sp.]|nr:hypothetical protein [Methanothrix sp.]
MLLIRIFALFFLAQSLAASGSETSPTIGDFVQGDLHWKENLSLDGYRLEAKDFSSDRSNPSVLLKLSRGGEQLMEQPLSQSESFTYDDAVLAEVDSIFMPDRSEGNDEPTARVRLALYAAPSIALRLISDKDSYDPGEEIRMKLIAENEGTEDAEGIRINLSSEPQCFQFKDKISKLPAGSSSQIGAGDNEKWIRLKAPLLSEPTRMQLSADARYSDKNDLVHESSGYCRIDVSGQITIHKRTTEEMVPGKEYPVILTLRNFGKENTTVDLLDSVSQEFFTGSDMSWTIDLPAEKTETVSYNIKASRPGAGLALPAAVASYKIGNTSYKSWSEDLSIDVFGPYLEIEKKVSPHSVHPGDMVAISIDIKNRGNRTVKAIINETVPAWARLLGGETKFDKILNSSEEASLSYRISCKEPGNYEIPETKVLYADARGDGYSANSSSLSLLVMKDEPPINMTEKETATAGHNVSTTLFILVLALIYFLLEKIL